MSATPGWYKRWCDARGVTPFHPETWDAPTRAAYRAELAECRALLPAVIDPDLEAAYRDVPAGNPWRFCPCHRAFEPLRDELGYPYHSPGGDPREPELQVTADEVDAWRAVDPHTRAFVSDRVARSLAYIDRFRPGSAERRADWEARSHEDRIRQRAERRAGRVNRGAA